MESHKFGHSIRTKSQIISLHGTKLWDNGEFRSEFRRVNIHEISSRCAFG